MKKVSVKRLLSLVMAILMVFPAIGLASSNASGTPIKAVYFLDEEGKLVFVNYAEAIEQSINGDHALYNAVREYVGIAEAKGRPIYLELFDGKILDYSLAMLDNLFELQDIIGKEKYEVKENINSIHELKIINGSPVIGSRDVDSQYAITISGPVELEVGKTGNYDVRAYGDGKGNVNYRARYDYAITGGSGKLEYLDGDTWKELPLSGHFGPNDGFTLTPNWDVTTKIRFTPAEEGTYSIELSLKDLNKNKTLASTTHTLVVTKSVVVPELPIEVENVFVGKSQITNNTYANIKIKDEYISVVEAVHVNDMAANKMEDDLSQWRTQVEEGTEAGELKGKIRVISTLPMIAEIEPVGDISVEFGTAKEDAIVLLAPTTAIKDNRGTSYDVALNWTIENYNGNLAGKYNAVATFALPEGVKENPSIKLEVKATVTVEKEIILMEFTPDSLLGNGFGLGKLVVYKELIKGYENATQYAVLYSVGSTETIVLTDRVEFGKAPADLVQNIKGINVISLALYDANGNYMGLVENIMNK